MMGLIANITGHSAEILGDNGTSLGDQSDREFCANDDLTQMDLVPRFLRSVLNSFPRNQNTPSNAGTNASKQKTAQACKEAPSGQLVNERDPIKRSVSEASYARGQYTTVAKGVFLLSNAIAAVFLLGTVGNAEPLRTFKDCDVCPEMVELPLGSFMMGAAPNEILYSGVLGRFKRVFRRDSFGYTMLNELPQQTVEIDLKFSIGVSEVTYNQWNACVDDDGCGKYAPPDRILIRTGPSISGEHPVVRVSFEDAERYVVWLNRKTGSVAYRLPTEAEWEYAARAGTRTRFSQGSDLSASQANFSRKATEVSTERKFPQFVDRRTLVKTSDLLASNPWGLRHMSGNAAEITRTCYRSAHPDWQRSSVWQEKSASPCDERVAKGGHFASPLSNLRPAFRRGISPTLRSPYYSFRIVKELN